MFSPQADFGFGAEFGQAGIQRQTFNSEVSGKPQNFRTESLSFAQSNEITNGKIHSKKNWLILTFDSVSQIEAEHARSWMLIKSRLCLL